MKKYLFFMILLICNFVSINAQTKNEKKKNKEALAEERYLEMRELVNSGVFAFYARVLKTQRGKSVFLSGGKENFLILEHSKTRANLQYFGVSQNPHYTGQGGISFDNDGAIYKTEFDDKKRRINISFKANNDTENFTISLNIYGNGNAYLNVSSTKRDRIGYDGDVREYKQDE